MPQVVTRVALENFRSYKKFETELSPRLTVVVGPNAAGKTNLIEAIQLTTATESFRRPRWEDVIAEGETDSRVDVTASGPEAFTELELRISKTTGRSYRVNGKKKSPQNVLGKIPSVVFSPDDLYMIKGPAEERRRAVDEAGDQLSSTYSSLRREYARVVKQRNTALKTGGGELMESLDSMLVSTGSKLTAHRARLAARIAEKASCHYEAMANKETLSVVMVPSWIRYGIDSTADSETEAAENIGRALNKVRAEETARGMTLVGPHRDDFLFSIEGSDARRSASQGQQRTAALAWKLAELDVMEEVCGKRPLLLLDDVMSELDAARRRALTALVTTGTQTVITTANLDYFESGSLEDALILRLGA